MDLLQTILRNCRAENYIDTFKNNGIDAFTLKILNEEDLKIIGVEEPEIRNLIVKHVANLQIPSEKKVDVIVDKQYALVVLNTISIHLNKHYANLTYALKREGVDLCDIKATPAVDCLQHCLISLEQSLFEYESKVFKRVAKRKKKIFHVLVPTIATTAILLFLSAKYFSNLNK